MSATNFVDGIKSLVSALINRRDAASQNIVVSQPLDPETLRQTYRNGIVNKIIRFKAGKSLDDTLQFENTDDEAYYRARLEQKVKEANRWMIAFGRGVIVMYHPDCDLSRPLGKIDPDRVAFKVFSGDMVTANSVDLDIMSPRYYKPLAYTIRGVSFHWSRVIDFTYAKPPELDAPRYQYGGISEIELIYDQVIADAIVQRASPKIIEKASTIFYKVKGFKDAMRASRESEMVEYFSRMEDIRGIHSAGLVDADDEVQEISQTIANLADADQITLRRLAMVTGMSITALVGENAKGLNSTGDNEDKMDQDMIESLQSEYLLEPINHLARKCGLGPVTFKENQGETARDRMDYDTKAIDNAVKLQAMGEDHKTYLTDKDVIQPDDLGDFFTDKDFDENKIERDKGGRFGKKGPEYPDPGDASSDPADYPGSDDVYSARWIEPVHEVRDPEKFKKLKKAMEEKGAWEGRPLLVYNTPNGITGATGSHRLAAARAVDKEFQVPVVQVSESAMEYESEDGETFLDLVGQGEDAKLADFLEEAGDLKAAELLRAEDK